MLNELNNINMKSFKAENVRGLKKINCFFGINGAGKSALSTYITHLSDKCMCFNSDFVEKNMLVEESNDALINGVKLKIGRQVEDKKKIESIKTEKESLIQEYDKASKELSQNKETLYRILTLQLRGAQKQFNTQKIHQKINAREDPVKALEKWRGEVSPKLEIKYNNVSEIDRKIDQVETQKNTVNMYLSQIKRVDFKQLESDLEQVIVKPNSKLSKDILNWLENGLKLHHISNDKKDIQCVCLFCGNKFSSKEIARKYIPLIKSEYSLWLDRCENTKEKISSLIDSLSNNYPLEDIYNNTRTILEEILDILNEKIEKPEIKLSISVEEKNKFNENVVQAQQLLKKYKGKFDNLQQIKQRTENYVKNWIGQALIDNDECDVLQNKIKTIQVQLKNNKQKQEKLDKEIVTIRARQSNLIEFPKICNTKFKSLGLRLKLEVDPTESGYLIKEINDIPLHVSDLSEGEKRILAFMIFFYQIRDKKDEIKSNIDYIVIDDPITSLDMENSYEIIEMINDLIKEVNTEKVHSQLFIFTNSSRAFHDIGYFDVKQQIIKRWVISKDMDGRSHVESVENDAYLNRSDYYKEIFNEVANFAFQPKREIESRDNGLFYCNKARILIESHAYANYSIANATSAKKNFNSLIDAYEIPDGKKNIFRKDLDVINKNSHGFSNIDTTILGGNNSSIVIQKAIRDIIGVLYCKDSKHVGFMLVSILKADKNKRKLLESWSKDWKK